MAREKKTEKKKGLSSGKNEILEEVFTYSRIAA